ncbi:MAG: hypothetical protein OXI01_04625 [Albidovulum sp.]|nr:hypothetical protein [Albidovulum sp.]
MRLDEKENTVKDILDWLIVNNLIASLSGPRFKDVDNGAAPAAPMIATCG